MSAGVTLPTLGKRPQSAAAPQARASHTGAPGLRSVMERVDGDWGDMGQTVTGTVPSLEGPALQGGATPRTMAEAEQPVRKLVPLVKLQKLERDHQRKYDDLERAYEGDKVLWLRRFEEVRAEKDACEADFRVNLELELQRQDKLARDVATAEKALTAMRLEKEDCEAQVAWMEKDISSLRAQLGEAVDRCRTCEQTLSSERLRHEEEVKRVGRLDQDLATRSDRLTAACGQCTDEAQKRVEQCLQDYDQVKAQNDDLQFELKQLRNEVPSLRSRWQSMQDQVKQAQQEKQLVNEQLLQALGRLDSLEQENKQLQDGQAQMLDDLQERFDKSVLKAVGAENLRDRHLRFERSTRLIELKNLREKHAQKGRQWSKDRQFLVSQLDRYKEKLFAAEQLYVELKKQSGHEQDQLRAQFDGWKQQEQAAVDALRDQNAAQRREAAKLALDADQSKVTEEALRVQLDQALATKQQLEQRCAALTSDMQQLQIATHTREEQCLAQLAQSEVERSGLQAELRLQQHQLREAKTDLGHGKLLAQQDAERLQQAVDKYKQLHSQKDTACSALQDGSRDLQEQLDRLMRLSDGTMEQLQKATQRAEEAEKQTEKVLQDKLMVEEELVCLRGGELATQVATLQARLREANEGSFSQEHGQLAELRKRATSAEDESDQLRIELERTKKELEHTRSGEVAQLQMRLNDVEDELKERQADVEQQQKKIDELNHQMNLRQSPAAQTGGGAPPAQGGGAASLLWSLAKTTSSGAPPGAADSPDPKQDAPQAPEPEKKQPMRYANEKGLKRQLRMALYEGEVRARELWELRELMQQKEKQWRQERANVHAEVKKKIETKWEEKWKNLQRANEELTQETMDKSSKEKSLRQVHRDMVKDLENERDLLLGEKGSLKRQLDNCVDHEIPRFEAKIRDLEEKLLQSQDLTQDGVTQLMSTLKRMETVETDRDEVLKDTQQMTRDMVQLRKQLDEQRRAADKAEKDYLADKHRHNVQLEQINEELLQKKDDMRALSDDRKDLVDRMAIVKSSLEQTREALKSEQQQRQELFEDKQRADEDHKREQRAQAEKLATTRAQHLKQEQKMQDQLSACHEDLEKLREEKAQLLRDKELREEELQAELGNREVRTMELTKEFHRAEHKLQEANKAYQALEISMQSKIDDEKSQALRQHQRLREKMEMLDRDRDELRKKLKKYAVFSKQTDENQCQTCGQDYLESENYNWSCRHHSGEWQDGAIYFCCGATTKETLGCKFSRHKPRVDNDFDFEDQVDETEQKKIRSKSSWCPSCQVWGHKPDSCPRDPNLRTGKSGRGALAGELRRVELLHSANVGRRRETPEETQKRVAGYLGIDIDEGEFDDADEGPMFGPSVKDPAAWWRTQDGSGGQKQTSSLKQKAKNKALIHLEAAMDKVEHWLQAAKADRDKKTLVAWGGSRPTSPELSEDGKLSASKSSKDAPQEKDPIEELQEAILNAKLRRVDPDLIARGEHFESQMKGTEQLREILKRVDVLVMDWRVNADPHGGETHVMESHVFELKEGLAVATKVEADGEMVAKADQKLVELNSLVELDRAIRSGKVERIQKAIQNGERCKIEKETLKEAEGLRVRLAAEEQLESAALEEQRAQGVSVKDILMVYNEPMMDKLRNAIEVAELARVAKEKVLPSKELLKQVELRVRLEKCIEDDDIRKLHDALNKAMEAKLPEVLLNRALARRLALKMKERLTQACKHDDHHEINLGLQESERDQIELPEEFYKFVLETRDSLMAQDELQQAIRDTSRSPKERMERLKMAIKQMARDTRSEASRKDPALLAQAQHRLRQLEAVLELKLAVDKDDLQLIISGIGVGESLGVEAHELEHARKKQAEIELQLRLEEAIAGEDRRDLTYALDRSAARGGMVFVEERLVERGVERLQELNFLRDLERLLADTDKTIAALSDRLEGADGLGYQHKIIDEARCVLARMQCSRDLDEAKQQYDHEKLAELIEDARVKGVEETEIADAERLRRRLIVHQDLMDAKLGTDIERLSEVIEAAKTTGLERGLILAAENRVRQLEAHARLELLIGSSEASVEALQEALAETQAAIDVVRSSSSQEARELDDDILKRGEHRIAQRTAEARLLKYMNVGVTGILALDAAVQESTRLQVVGPVMDQALQRQRYLTAIKALRTSQDAADIQQVFAALEEARAAGVGKADIDKAQQRLERLLAGRQPQARIELLMALEARKRSRLHKALEEARLCGVDTRLLEQGGKVLAELPAEDPEEEPPAEPAPA